MRRSSCSHSAASCTAWRCLSEAPVARYFRIHRAPCFRKVVQCVHRYVTESSLWNVVHVDGFSPEESGVWNQPAENCLIAKYELGSFPAGTSGKEPACQCRRCKRRGFDPWVGKIPWRRPWQPLQYSCLENPLDRGAWRAAWG